MCFLLVFVRVYERCWPKFRMLHGSIDRAVALTANADNEGALSSAESDSTRKFVRPMLFIYEYPRSLQRSLATIPAPWRIRRYFGPSLPMRQVLGPLSGSLTSLSSSGWRDHHGCESSSDCENEVGTRRRKNREPRRTETEKVAVTVDGGIYEQCVSACIRS